ncbi:MAG TPA: PQQ-binding-like beta-propeller repeat protein [Streptosporangiaceae bacterium]
MLVARGSAMWARRGILAAVLIGAAVVPGRAGSAASRACTGPHCARPVGTVRWSRVLPGSWVARSGTQGTVLAGGQAYAGVGGGLAAVGLGDSVAAYRLSDGRPLWTASLADFPVGSAVVSVRAWDGVVTAGVSVPGIGDAAGHRDEVVLSAATGQLIRTYHAAPYGGAVLADAGGTVVVGTTAVTSYDNATGKVRWRVPTGPVPQAWRVAGSDLFVTVAKDGYLGTAPVTGLLRIDLRTGDRAVLRLAARQPFDGGLSGAIGGAVLFSGPDGLHAYSGTDGRLLWSRAGVVLEAADPVRPTVYVTGRNSLVGLDPLTGKVVTSAATLGAAGLYTVSDGVALGLDEGALGDAWGYRLSARRVTWTAKNVPWPHFFVDLSGIGGSVAPGGSTVVLASCARLGPAPADGAAPPCLRPRLVAVGP